MLKPRYPKINTLDSFERVIQGGLDAGEIQAGSPAGTDIIPVFYAEGTGPIEMGDIDTISFSTHREIMQIRPLGRVGPAGFVQGKRTIAGSIIVKLRQGSELRKILGRSHMYYNRMLQDELPPFNIVIIVPITTNDGLLVSGANPYVIVISGIKIVDTASSVSIDDTIMEQQFSYIATDIQDLTSAVDLTVLTPDSEIDPDTSEDLRGKQYPNDLDKILPHGPQR